ncbi:MAG: SUMF1/EgtB/PvdO family nonheme iron enzyme [Calothrix sp. MO_167.B42]|nr:SUMF1/EgtB/PvdO family nonheme iron enzyme [Calothrix sp. MO_167.B42]
MLSSSPSDRSKTVSSPLVGKAIVKVIDSLITGVFNLANNYIADQGNQDGDEIQQKFQTQLQDLRDKNHREFQIEQFQKQQLLQKALVNYKRKKILQTAIKQQEAVLASLNAYNLLPNWPLKVVPALLLNSEQRHNYHLPLKIIAIPPKLDWEQFGITGKKRIKIDRYLTQGLEGFFQEHYSLKNFQRAVEIVKVGWHRRRYQGISSIQTIFEMLRSQPTVILDLEIQDHYLNFRVFYWEVGQKEYSSAQILSQFPFREIVYESAKSRARKWKIVKDLLEKTGQNPQEINLVDSYNLEVLQVEDKIRQLGIDPRKLPRRYKLKQEDLTALAQFLLGCNCLVTACLADIHHLMINNVTPKLPGLLPQLISNLPNEKTIETIVSQYSRMFKIIEDERLEKMPELGLELANSFKYLPNKLWAQKQLDYSIDCWLKLRGINCEAVSHNIEAMKSVLTFADRQYVEKVKKCLAELEDEQKFTTIQKLIDRAIENPDAYYKSGLYRAKQKDYQGAVADFDRAVILNNNFADAYCHRGLALFKLGRPKDAVDSYQQALAINPNHQEIQEYSKYLPAKADKYEFEVITVNSSGKRIHINNGEAQFFMEDLGSDTLIEMVAIPGGKFWMGSPDNQGYEKEKPQHKVEFSPFFIGKYPVTQLQWETVAKLPQIERPLKAKPSSLKGDRLPVEKVSWYDAVEFCARLSQKTGRKYRLPSEAEWEYACRAGTTTPFHFGHTITADLANYDGKFIYSSEAPGQNRKQTTPVGNFPPNGFGLHDIHGNVWEWCADNWHDDYIGAPHDASPWVDGGNSQRSPLRGGSWLVNPMFCRSAYRFQFMLGRNYINFSIGFRVVCTLEIYGS